MTPPFRKDSYPDLTAAIRGVISDSHTPNKANSVHEARGTHYALLGKQAVSYDAAKQYALWGTKKGETDPFHAQVLLTGPVTSRTPADTEKAKKEAARTGWHDFRVQYFTPGVGAGARDSTQAFTQGVQAQGGWERAEAAAAARLRGRNKRKRK